MALLGWVVVPKQLPTTSGWFSPMQEDLSVADFELDALRLSPMAAVVFPAALSVPVVDLSVPVATRGSTLPLGITC